MHCLHYAARNLALSSLFFVAVNFPLAPQAKGDPSPLRRLEISEQDGAGHVRGMFENLPELSHVLPRGISCQSGAGDYGHPLSTLAQPTNFSISGPLIAFQTGVLFTCGSLPPGCPNPTGCFENTTSKPDSNFKCRVGCTPYACQDTTQAKCCTSCDRSTGFCAGCPLSKECNVIQ